MKKVGIICLFSGLLLIGFSGAKCNTSDLSSCNKATLGKANSICTMEYAPICAEVQVQCIKAPCPAIKQTFGNKCMMNANNLAKFLYEGECKEDIDLSNCESYFDGCNTCFVSGGEIGGCTKMYCEKPTEPKCLIKKANDVDLKNCEFYFDGCNNCSVLDGKLDACTEMYCKRPKEPKCLKYKDESIGMANPASKFCIENSGSLEILDGTGGQYGICKFKDGSKCEEWNYFRGECKPEYKKIHNVFDRYFEKYTSKFQKLEDRKFFLEEFKFKIQSFSKGAKLGLKKTYEKIINAIDLYINQ